MAGLSSPVLVTLLQVLDFIFFFIDLGGHVANLSFKQRRGLSGRVIEEIFDIRGFVWAKV